MKRPSRKKMLASSISFMLIMTIFVLATFFEYNREIESQKRAVSDSINTASAKLEGEISSYIFYVYSVKSFIHLSSDMDEDELTRFLSELINTEEGIFKSFTVIKDTTVLFVYPKDENQAAIGKDLSKIPEQSEAILSVKNTGIPLITGPVNLVQGGKGIIIRMPIYSKDSGASKNIYWGQVSVILSYDAVLEKSGIKTIGKDTAIKVSNLKNDADSNTIVWESGSDKIKDPVSSIVKVLDNRWLVEAEPISGWGGYTPTFFIILLLGIISSVMGALYVMNIISSKEDLETKVTLRTKQLEDRQKELVESEKQASLGRMIAGVAHEINTPLGVAITSTSYVETKHHDILDEFENQTLRKTSLKNYFTTVSEALNLTGNNLNKVSNIVSNFKQVAIDQSSQELRRINLGKYLRTVVSNLYPKLKNTTHEMEINCPDDIDIASYPGAIAQMVTNLVDDSIIHGFENVENGKIEISVVKNDANIRMIYRDNGIGIKKEYVDMVFEPYITTKRGLGLYIVHNIATQVLQGKISLITDEGRGVEFIIEFQTSQNG